MTDEQINAAIAKAVNWPGNLICRNFNGNLWPTDPPNYCSDLNAMAEAEKVLCTETQFMNYCLTLYDVTQKTRWPVSATARQRAEAFLRTLGKWEEATNKDSLFDQKEVRG